MPRHDPQVRLQHMLEYAREATGLMRDKRWADLDTDRTLGLVETLCAGPVPAHADSGWQTWSASLKFSHEHGRRN